MKFVEIHAARRTAEMQRVGECWLLCLWHFNQLQENEGVQKSIVDMCGLISRDRRSALGIPTFDCGVCKFPTKLSSDVPMLVVMQLSKGLNAFICEKCVQRRNIPIDKTFPSQHRIWINGEKLLRYGNIFVDV
jgi:hypothetical protein